MEIWDAYDINMNKLNTELIRGEEVPQGMYHIVPRVIVRNSDGKYLAMQRSFSKPGGAGLFEISASGSIIKNETAYDGAIRELYEETGISVDHLIELEGLTEILHPCIYEVFFVDVDIKEDSIILQEDETIDYQWIPKSEVMSYIHSDKHVAGRTRKHITRAIQRYENIVGDNHENISK